MISLLVLPASLRASLSICLATAAFEEQAQGQAMAVGIAACAFFYRRAERGPVLLPALPRLAAICRLVAIGSSRLLTAQILEPNYQICFDDPA